MAPRETLQPGDLCVILNNGSIPLMCQYLAGKTVVLLRVAPLTEDMYAPFAPFWQCTGMPSHWAASHMILRKIPPDRMLDARTHMTDEPETQDEELTV